LSRFGLPRRKNFQSVVIAFIIFAAACRSTPDERPPGYLIAGIESHPLQLDPRYSTDANAVRVGNLIYSALLRSDEQLRLQLDLATSWRRLDERSYEFSLRHDVRFHNGQPLTAADVKYTFESILDPAARSPKRGLLKHLASVDQTGPYDLRFHLDAPHAPFVEQFTLGIVPVGSPANGAPPPGTGPFMLEAIDAGEKVTLKANADYWAGKPKLAGVVFKTVPDAMVRALEFKKGVIDFMQNDIEPDMLPWLKQNSDADIGVHQGTTFQYIGINLTHPILRLRKVRQALALAIDRDAMIKHLLKDTGTAASGLLSPISWAYDDGVRRWPYDPDRAKKLLDEAGFPDPDGDGPLPRFHLSFKTTNIDLRRRIAEAIKEQLQQVGIELEIRSYEWGTFFSDVKKGNFHLYSLAWVGIMDPDIEYQIFHSASAPPNGDNRGRYSNPQLDRLLEQGRITADEPTRKRIYSQAAKILADDLPYVPLWWWKNVIVKKPSVQDFVAYPDGDFFSLRNVSLRESAIRPR
jgi:peptide/nickel transport system substrate-binding protein